MLAPVVLLWLHPRANSGPFASSVGGYCSFAGRLHIATLPDAYDPARQLNGICEPVAARAGRAVDFYHDGEPAEAGVCQRSLVVDSFTSSPRQDRGHG